jgi:hypothetical protein
LARLPWAALCLPGLIAWLYAESLFGGRILAQLASLRDFEPWRSQAVPQAQEANYLLLDQSLVMLPWLEFFAQELWAGHLPLWNPHNYLGQPIHAANTGALFWPLHWIFFAWPERALWAWMEALEMGLTGLGMALFLGALGLKGPARWLGTLAYTGSGFQIAWALHPHTHVSCLLPWGLWLVERLCLGASPGRLAGLGLVFGLCALGGHLQTALHVGLLIGAWGLVRTLSGPKRLGARAWACMALAAVLGASLAAAQLLPLREYLAESRAARLFDQIDVTAPVAWQTPAALMLAPEHLGRPDRNNYTGPQGDNLNYNELIGGHIGKIALLLACIALIAGRKDGRRIGLALLCLLCALVAWQFDPLYGWARSVPLLRSTKLMRLSLGLACFGSVLAAFGLAAILRGQRPWLGVAACLAVTLELGAFARGYNPQIDPATALPGSAVTDYLASQPPGPRTLCVAGDCLPPNANLFYRISMVTGYDSIESERTAELVGLLTSDPRASWFMKEIRYFDRLLPLANALNIKWVLSSQPLPAPLKLEEEPPEGPAIYSNPEANQWAYLAQQVERIDDPQARLARLGSLEFDAEAAIVESAPPAGFELYSRPYLHRYDGTGTYRKDSRNAMVSVLLKQPALLVISEAFDPGWRAMANGQPVELVRVNHALSGLWLPAGETRVELSYQPKSVRQGLWISAASLILLLGLALWGWRRGRRRAPRAPAGLLLGDDWGSAPPRNLASAGLLLLLALGQVGCRTPPPARSGEYEIVRGTPERSFEVWSQGRLVGLAQRYLAQGLDGRGWTVVQNAFGQDLGLLDEHGRAWRYRPFGAEPELLGAFDTSEGAARILGLAPEGLELRERALEQPKG